MLRSQDYSLINLIKEVKPRTLEDMKNLGLKLRKIGDGAFRDVYKIVGINLVIKVPISDIKDYYHSISEYKTVKRILSLKKYEKLHRFMPNIVYLNRYHGLMVMEYYKKLKENPIKDSLLYTINTLFEFVWKNDGMDIRSENVGLKGSRKDGQYPVILDLGYFDDLGKYGRS